MQIIDLAAADAHRLVPLLQDLHALHVSHQPDRHLPRPEDAALTAWLGDWLGQDGVHALAAESPQGALMGYLIYAIEHRPALPIRAAETRAMLHQIAVATAFHRIGVATALMTAMKARLAASGIAIIATTYAPFNAASAGLMHSMGLAPVLTLAEWRG